MMETQKIRELLDSLIGEHQTWVDNLTPLRDSIDDKIVLVNSPLEAKVAALEAEKADLVAQLEMATAKIATEIIN